jgi:hypothetical protein
MITTETAGQQQVLDGSQAKRYVDAFRTSELVFFLALQRNSYSKAPWLSVLGGDRSLTGSNTGFNNSHAQAHPAGVSITGGFWPEKGIKEAIKIFLSNSRPGILDCEQDLSILFLGSNHDWPGLTSVFHRIA